MRCSAPTAEAATGEFKHRGTLRLPLELLELALQELEQHQREDIEPQVQATLATFSTRLRSLSTRGSSNDELCGDTAGPWAGSFRRQVCPQPMTSMNFDAESSPPDSAEFIDKPLPTKQKDGSETGPLECGTGSMSSKVQGCRRQGSAMSRKSKQAQHKEFVQLFSKLDLDGNGRVGPAELRASLRGAGMTNRDIRKFMAHADTSGDGMIHRDEFIRALDVPEVFSKFRQLMSEHSVLVLTNYRCMLRQSSPARVCWDLLCSCALAYVAIMEPAFLAFSDMREATFFFRMSFAIDALFLCDVLLNFRTGFYAADGFEVMEPCAVAKNYIKTWFVLDLISSLPLENLMMDDINLQPLRLLKYWKVARLLKVLKVSKALSAATGTDFAMDVMDVVRVNRLFGFLPMFFVLFMMLLACHWLACFMVVSGDGFLQGYQDVSRSYKTTYISAYYWAVTTISTVGYGDITPGSTSERLYAILAMSIGGAFYGYFIAKFTSIVTHSGLQQQVYEQKLTEVYAWLQFHQFPRDLRKRARRYFERSLKLKAHIDDDAMLSSLSPELRDELSQHMVQSEVRNLPLFEEMPMGVVARLAKILTTLEVEPSEHIVQQGEVGSAMYVITNGTVQLEMGEGEAHCDRMPRNKDDVLETGDCFGEEVLLEPGSLYEYDAIAKTRVFLVALPIDAFHAEFSSYPHVLEQLVRNAEHMRTHDDGIVTRPKNFESETMHLLRELRDSKQDLKLGIEAVQAQLQSISRFNGACE